MHRDRSLAEMEDGARQRLAELRQMEAGEYPFPERQHIGELCMRLQQQQEQTTIDWAVWARAPGRPVADSGGSRVT